MRNDQCRLCCLDIQERLPLPVRIIANSRSVLIKLQKSVWKQICNPQEPIMLNSGISNTHPIHIAWIPADIGIDRRERFDEMTKPGLRWCWHHSPWYQQTFWMHESDYWRPLKAADCFKNRQSLFCQTRTRKKWVGFVLDSTICTRHLLDPYPLATCLTKWGALWNCFCRPKQDVDHFIE